MLIHVISCALIKIDIKLDSKLPSRQSKKETEQNKKMYNAQEVKVTCFKEILECPGEGRKTFSIKQVMCTFRGLSFSGIL
jgi:hypothetical protein